MATNASCGIFKLPMLFIRFLPSFCADKQGWTWAYGYLRNRDSNTQDTVCSGGRNDNAIHKMRKKRPLAFLQHKRFQLIAVSIRKRSVAKHFRLPNAAAIDGSISRGNSPHPQVQGSELVKHVSSTSRPAQAP